MATHYQFVLEPMSAPVPPPSNVLELVAVGVRFGGLIALRDVSIRVPESSFNGLIGPNGAGKSTLFNVISGLVTASSGQIRIAGIDVTREPAHARARLGVQRTFQSVQLIRSMTVVENILTGLHASAARSAYRGTDIDRASAMAEALGLGDCLHRTTERLTFRQQRYVEIARALVGEPRLLMLDEPAAGLSGPEVEHLGDMLLRMQERSKFAVLLVEHVISLVMRVCPHVTVLENGSLLAAGPGSSIMSNSEVVRAYLGEGIDA